MFDVFCWLTLMSVSTAIGRRAHTVLAHIYYVNMCIGSLSLNKTQYETVFVRWPSESTNRI